jgi:hypothetical protein
MTDWTKKFIPIVDYFFSGCFAPQFPVIVYEIARTILPISRNESAYVGALDV